MPDGGSARYSWWTGWLLFLHAVLEIAVGLRTGGAFQVVVGLLALLAAWFSVALSVHDWAMPWRDRP